MTLPPRPAPCPCYVSDPANKSALSTTSPAGRPAGRWPPASHREGGRAGGRTLIAPNADFKAQLPTSQLFSATSQRTYLPAPSERLCRFPGAVQKDFRQRTQGTLRQCDDAGRIIVVGQLDREQFQGQVLAEAQNRQRQHGDESTSRQHLMGELQGKGYHGGARRLEARRGERLRNVTSRYAVDRRQNPRFVDEIGKLHFAPSAPLAFRARHHDEAVNEQRFDRDVLLKLQCGCSSYYQLHIPLTQFTVHQRNAVGGYEVKRGARIPPRDAVEDDGNET